MGEIMFGNEFFDHWLHQKSNEILDKVDREKITTEEMLILSLKAQTNHFYHMDQEFRGEFKKIDQRFEQMEQRFEQMEQRFEKMDQRFEKMDQRLTQMMSQMIKIVFWVCGFFGSLISGLYFKIFIFT